MHFPKKVIPGKRHSMRVISAVLPFSIGILIRAAGPAAFVIFAAITCMSGIVPAVSVYVDKMVINRVTEALNSASFAWYILAVTLAIRSAVLIFDVLLSKSAAYLNFYFGKRITLELNADILRKIDSLGYALLESPEVNDMLVRAQNQASTMPLQLVFKFFAIFTGAITFISMAAILISFSKLCLCAALLISVPLCLVQSRFGEKTYELQHNRTSRQRLSNYLLSLLISKHSIPEIRSFGLCSYIYRKWYETAHDFFIQDIGLYRRRYMYETIFSLLPAMSTVAVTGVIVYINCTRSLSLTLGDIFMYSGAFSGALSSMRSILDGIAGIYENSIFLNDLIEFNKLESCAPVTQKSNMAIPKQVDSIELVNISFCYPGSKTITLKNVSVKFERGKTTLIIGANGAGKSTLIKLIARLYEPTTGCILLNGIDVRQFDLNEYRRCIGIIFQDFLQYALTAKENISVGDIDCMSHGPLIVTAAQKARAHNFVSELPEKYDTVLSKLFEQGQELSIGQWQRISLARLFMKNSPVLIFDEPTASLDVLTESGILGEIQLASRTKICILISHRMSRAQTIDDIIVLEHGVIAEQGTFTQLISNNGKFTNLWQIYNSNK